MSLHHGLLYIDDGQETVYPNVGQSVSTGYVPTILATADYAQPEVGSSFSVGYQPTILPEDNLTISGMLPDLTVATGVADSFNISGTLSDLQGYITWGVEAAFDIALPSLSGSIDLGFQFTGTFPTLEISTDIIIPFTFNGALPYSEGIMDCGFIIEGRLPETQSSLNIEQDNNFIFNIDLQGLKGSAEFSDSFDIKGSLVPLAGNMELESYDYFNIINTLPELSGLITFEDPEDFTFFGKLPSLDGLMDIELEQSMLFDSKLPPLDLNLFSFQEGIINFIPTSDEIIRHRRGYDNG